MKMLLLVHQNFAGSYEALLAVSVIEIPVG